MSKTDIRVKEFTKDEFRKVREILIEWNYEWLNYDLVESSDDDNVDVTFRLVDDVLSIGEFMHLMFSIGYETAFRK